MQKDSAALRRVLVPLIIAVLLSVAPFRVACAEDDRRAFTLKDKELQKGIHKAIDDGISYLRRIQRQDGNWSQNGINKGGYTALALYALAASGVPADDMTIKRGVNALYRNTKDFRNSSKTSTYSNSLLVLALTRIDPKRHRKLIHKAANRIERGSSSPGFWGYRLGGLDGAPAKKRDFDNKERLARNREADRRGTSAGHAANSSEANV